MKVKYFKRTTAVLLMVMILFTGVFSGSTTVNAAAKARINITNISMSKGQTRQLKVSGSGTTKWKSSKKSVVSVTSKGKIRARKKGTAVITATKNGRNYKCNVVVNTPSKKNQDVLIVYFSKTGTTKSVAQKIKKLTGGDLLRIKEKNAYPSDYEETTEIAQEELDDNSRPAVTTVAANMKSYDVVYVGFPIWWGMTPRVVNTFLEKYNLSGKTIIPFCTSGGSDIEDAAEEIEDTASRATVLEGYTADSGSTAEIRSWLRSIGQLK